MTDKRTPDRPVMTGLLKPEKARSKSYRCQTRKIRKKGISLGRDCQGRWDYSLPRGEGEVRKKAPTIFFPTYAPSPRREEPVSKNQLPRTKTQDRKLVL